MIPFDPRSPMVTSGIRIGVPAITTRGLKENQMPQIAQWIDHAICNANQDTELAQIRTQVADMMADYPLFAW